MPYIELHNKKNKKKQKIRLMNKTALEGEVGSERGEAEQRVEYASDEEELRKSEEERPFES